MRTVVAFFFYLRRGISQPSKQGSGYFQVDDVGGRGTNNEEDAREKGPKSKILQPQEKLRKIAVRAKARRKKSDAVILDTEDGTARGK